MPQPPFWKPAELPPDAVEVGRITDAWGVKGWFKVLATAPPRGAFAGPLVLQPSERGAKTFFAGTVLLPIRQAHARIRHHRRLGAGVDDRDAAEALRGAHLCATRGLFRRPPMTSTTGWT